MDSKIWDDFQEVTRLVVNVNTQGNYDTYCGRPGPWGNTPFPVGARMTRQQAVANHQRWLNGLIRDGDVTPFELAHLVRTPEGQPRTLGCYCSPQICHCHTLVRYGMAAWEGSEHLESVMAQPTVGWYRANAHRSGRLPVGNDGYEVSYGSPAAPQQPAQMEMDMAMPQNARVPTSVGKTTVEGTAVRSILTAQRGRASFVNGYDYTLNPYQGCSAACDYCYAAGYTGNEELSKNWGLWVKAKFNAAQALAREAHLLDDANVYMATVTDPYQPVERQADITGSILDVMARHTPKLVVQTRFPLVTRDIPRFQAIVANGGQVQVNVTVTTDDDELRRTLEPKCPSIPARLKALTELTEAGITTCATITPMLPVKKPDDFASRLRDTGIRKVIIQQFHRAEGSGEQFRRATRPAALEWLEQEWGHNWRSTYSRRYRNVANALREAFPGNVGEGQQGFAPPF